MARDRLGALGSERALSVTAGPGVGLVTCLFGAWARAPQNERPGARRPPSQTALDSELGTPHGPGGEILRVPAHTGGPGGPRCPSHQYAPGPVASRRCGVLPGSMCVRRGCWPGTAEPGGCSAPEWRAAASGTRGQPPPPRARCGSARARPGLSRRSAGEKPASSRGRTRAAPRG